MFGVQETVSVPNLQGLSNYTTHLSPEMQAEYIKRQSAPETVPTGTPLFSAGLAWDFAGAPHLRWMGVEVVAKNGGAS